MELQQQNCFVSFLIFVAISFKINDIVIVELSETIFRQIKDPVRYKILFKFWSIQLK